MFRSTSRTFDDKLERCGHPVILAGVSAHNLSVIFFIVVVVLVVLVFDDLQSVV
jgi:hypothetical protein